MKIPAATSKPQSGTDPNLENQSELVEDVDYVVDKQTGFFIFTKDYLLRRGYCCKNACRNCPYGFTVETPTETT